MITEQRELQIIQIGNSRGIRIPKRIIDRIGLKTHVTVKVTDNTMTIKPSFKPRVGWESDFKRCHDRGDDVLIIPDTLERIFN